jgi:hypothetical protein
MKKTILLFYILLNGLYAAAQSPTEYTLQIKDISVNDSGKELKIDTLLSKKIYLDQDNQILLYENASYRYYTSIKMARSGNRIKVIEKNYILDKSNQIAAKGKLTKHVQYINVSMPGKFEHSSGEYLLIDKNNFTSMKVTFLRRIYYGPNQPN